MDQQTFLKSLTLLASQCGKAMTRDEVGLYDRAFGKVIGYQAACNVLEKCLIERSARDVMPSVGDLRRMSGVALELSIEEQAEAVVAKVVAAISQRGYYWFHSPTWPQCAVDQLGEWGWQLVKEWGGWQRLVEDSGVVDVSVLRSQLRRLAVTVGLRAKAGVQGAPQLPRPATGLQSGAKGLQALAIPAIKREG